MPGFERLAHNKPTLEALAKADPAQLKALGLRASEPNTMVEVAKGLIQFGSERTLSLITTQANATVGRIHDRMPVMLRDDVARSIWLDGGAHLDDVAALLGPAPEDFLTPRRVSRLVSNARNEGPDCLAEAGVEGLGLV
jgi:putative SOS response-associated peptidase YedK